MLSEHQEFVILEDMYIWANAFMRYYVDLSFPREWENDNIESLYKTLDKIAWYFAKRVPATKLRHVFSLLLATTTNVPRLKLVAIHKTFRFIQKSRRYRVDPPMLLFDAYTALASSARAQRVGGCSPLVRQVFENPLLLREISEFTNLHHLEGTCRDIRDAAFGVVLYRIKETERVLTDSAFRSLVVRRVNLSKQVSIKFEIPDQFRPELTRRLRQVRMLELYCERDALSFLEVPGIWGNITFLNFYFDFRSLEEPWLYKFPNARTVWLSFCPRVNLEGLGQLRNLESILFDGMGMGMQLTSFSLQGLPRLRQLKIRSVDFGCFGNFGFLPSLHNLALCYTKFSSLKPFVRSAPNLRTLKITYAPHLVDFSFVSGLQSLESLEIPGHFVNPALAALPLLKKRYLFTEHGRAPICAPEALEVLGALVTLEELTLHWFPFRDLKKLKNLINLKDLGLSRVEVDDLRPLVHLENLQCLRLGHLKINSHPHFKDLRALKRIMFSRQVEGISRDIIERQRPDLICSSCSFESIYF